VSRVHDKHVVVLAAAACAFVIAAAPAPAPAVVPEPTTSIELVEPDFETGMASVAVRGPDAPVVRLYVDGILLASGVQESGSTTFGPWPVSGPVRVTANGHSLEGALLWSSDALLDPACFAPSPPQLSVRSGQVLASEATIVISSPVTVTAVAIATAKVWGGPARVESVTIGPHADARLRVNMPYGPGWIRVKTGNAFGISEPTRVPVANVGRLSDIPGQGRIVLVDKRALRAYEIVDRRVRRSWPVAIGMPRTPTPSGLFKLAPALPAGGVWGPLRRPLLRSSGGRWVRTSYYIHGTNAPWSIGMMASHGCVRMYNSHIRTFSKVVPSGTRVRIR
jgi:lipoprotein-anchoring transpeptidase ErfK/SrfK